MLQLLGTLSPDPVLGLCPWTQLCDNMICMWNISAKLQMCLLCHWVHYACEKLSRGHSPLSLWLNHRTHAWFYIGAGEGQLSLCKPRPCRPNISAYRCTKEHYVAFKIRQNAFPAGAPPLTPLGDLMTLPQTPSLLGRGHDSPAFGTRR